jgi:uncharacterized RDD family membrane protein YckC
MMNQSAPISISPGHAMVPVERASFWQRLLAYVIDLFILGFVNGCLSLASGLTSSLIGNDESQVLWAVVWAIIGVGIPTAYFVWPYSTSGQTLGKRALQIKVVSMDGSPLNWRKGVLRYLGYLPSSLAFDLGFLWSIWDADKQAWHDKVAGTYVVPASTAREQLQGTIEPLEVRWRQRRWLLNLGIPTILLVSGGLFLFVSFVQRGVAEVREMGPWPGLASHAECDL